MLLGDLLCRQRSLGNRKLCGFFKLFLFSSRVTWCGGLTLARSSVTSLLSWTQERKHNEKARGSR